MGTYNSSNDFTAFNIIEDNDFYLSGHDVIDCYEPSNVIQNNWCYSPPWYVFPSCYTNTTTNVAYWGSRLIKVGFQLGYRNVIQSNDVDYSGYVPDGPGAITLSDSVSNIVRFNRVVCAAGSSIQVYGGKYGDDPCSNNYIYNNSCAFGGYNTTFITT